MNFYVTSGLVEACQGKGFLRAGALLGNGHNSPGPETAQSLAEHLDTMDIRPVAKALDGTQRRGYTFDVSCGTVGDSAECTLWEASVADSGQAERNLTECCPKHDGK